ncbi:MAG: hypothetical protein LBH75_08595 [Treponema sp.]|jgi:hypothetical protein|nr:hypothetical protein [Treponema sp.]
MEMIHDLAAPLYYKGCTVDKAQEETARREYPKTFAIMMHNLRRLYRFAAKVEEMRLLQKQYITTRDNLTLAKAKDAEREIDALVKQVLHERDGV